MALSDERIDDLAQNYGLDWVDYEPFARAIEAEVRKQDEAQEPVAWLSPWRADQVTTDYDAYGKHGIPLYTAPQPTQAQAGAVPLTDEQIEALPLWKRFVGLWPETRREIVRTIEHHHGIKGGQHGTE